MKSKSSSKPPKWARPYIESNLAASQNVFNANQPVNEQYSRDMYATYGRLAPGAEQGIIAGQGLINDTIGGKYLAEGNPYMDGILSQTRSNVMNDVNSQFSGAGRYGSGMYAKILGRELADAENRVRYDNYAQERQNQMAAAQEARAYMSGSQGLLESAAALPWYGVQAQSGNIRQNSNGYGTQTQSGGLLSGITQGLGAASKAVSLFSDRRLKTDIKKVGEYADGLGRYRWTYIWGEPAEGVMADEVAELRPWALGPVIAGYATVNYGAL